MATDFDPNTSHPEPDEWASYCPMSSARCRGADGWSTHETRAAARRGIAPNLSRYGDERDAVMYHRENGLWVERERWHWDNSPVSDDPADGTWQTWRHTTVPEPESEPISLKEAAIVALRVIERVIQEDGYYIAVGMQAVDRERGLGYANKALEALCAYTGFKGDV